MAFPKSQITKIRVRKKYFHVAKAKYVFLYFFINFINTQISNHSSVFSMDIMYGICNSFFSFNTNIIASFTSKCIICENQSLHTSSNGSKFDFLCSVYLGQIVGLFPYVRTFRQYNTKSPIIILVDKNGISKLTPEDKIALKNCGLTVICIGNVNGQAHNLQIIRLIYFFNFLAKCKKYFRRCIFTDGFDVFFQGDPFTAELSEQYLYLTVESESNNFLNVSYIQKFPHSYQIICSHNIINSGVFAGGTLIMHDFFSLFLEMFFRNFSMIAQTIKIDCKYTDQDALNYFVYVYLNKHSFLKKKVVLLNTSNQMASIIGEIRHSKIDVSWNFPLVSITNKNVKSVPLLVHQYSYSISLIRSLVGICGRLDHQNSYSEYYRILNI